MKHLFFAFSSLIILFFSCKKDENTLPNVSEAKTALHKITVEGVEREFIVYQPAGISNGTKVPLILMFHGSGGTHQKYYNISGWKEKADQVKCLVAFPQALEFCVVEDGKDNVETRWHTSKIDTILCSSNIQQPKDDVLYTTELVEFVKSNYGVDDKRVYATGFSNGGSFVSYLYDKTDNIFAAYNETGSISSYVTDIPANNTPLFIAIGDRDPHFTEPSGVQVMPFNETFLDLPIIQTVLKGNLPPLKLKNKYTVSTNENYLLFTFNQTTDGVKREFRLMLIKNAEHQYPNGINHPFVMADYDWDWFENYRLP